MNERRRKPKNYKEGDWFLVPLDRTGEFAVGRIARANRGLLIAYVFGPSVSAPPAAEDLAAIRAENVVDVMKVADVGIRNLEWPLLGGLPGWENERAYWPVPAFGHIDLMDPERGVIRQLKENLLDYEEKECDRETALSIPEDGLRGHLSAERRISRYFPEPGVVLSAEEARRARAARALEKWVARWEEMGY